MKEYLEYIFVLRKDGDNFNAATLSALVSLLSSFIAILSLVFVLRKNSADLRKSVREQKINSIINLSSDFHDLYNKYIDTARKIGLLMREEGTYYLNLHNQLSSDSFLKTTPELVKKEVDELLKTVYETKVIRDDLYKVVYRIQRYLFDLDRRSNDILNAITPIKQNVEETNQILHAEFLNDIATDIDKCKIYQPKLLVSNPDKKNMLDTFNESVDYYLKEQWKLLKKGK